jgi:hypothetical protein
MEPTVGRGFDRGKKKQKNMYYIFMEIHMAKNTKYLTMAFTHKTSLPNPKLAFPIET